MTHIWVDADACPVAVKEVLYKASERTKIPVTLVANQSLSVPPYPQINSIQVEKGFDVADNLIAARCELGDLVITQDIPLAAEIVAKGVTAINPRGETYTEANIRQRLAMRDLMEELRSTQQISGGPPPFGPKEKQKFANSLDRWIAKNHNT